MSTRFDAVRASLGYAEGVTTGRMFGSEGLKIRGKIFAMEVKGALVVKITARRAGELRDSGVAKPFDPGHGRLMKEWVAVAPDAHADWLELAREALEFVRGKR